MKLVGGCHCGAIRYEADGPVVANVLCHCADCRRHAGAPMVGWVMYAAAAVTVTRGEARIYRSTQHGRRHFCADCGTGLFYTNDVTIPGLTDIRSATFDDPDAVPPEAHVQVAERIGWMAHVHELPLFERYRPVG